MSWNPSSDPITRALLRVPVPWVFVLAYLAGVGVEVAFHFSRFIPANTLLTNAGLIVFTLGAVIAAWGWILFHNARTTRVPGETSTTLVTWGPYRFTRNPMYVGLSVAYLGEAAILHQLIPVLFLPLVIVYLNQAVIPLEEDRLQAAFGPAYERYRSEVRRWL